MISPEACPWVKTRSPRADQQHEIYSDLTQTDSTHETISRTNELREVCYWSGYRLQRGPSRVFGQQRRGNPALQWEWNHPLTDDVQSHPPPANVQKNKSSIFECKNTAFDFSCASGCFISNTRDVSVVAFYIYQMLLSKVTYSAFRLYIFVLSVCVFPGNWTHDLCAANAMLYHWATPYMLPYKTHILMLSLVEPTGCSAAAHSKYCGKTDHQCGEDVVYVKTGTKPFTQNSYLLETSISVALASHTREPHV